MMTSPKAPIDFAIITALQEELDAVLSKLSDYQVISTPSDALPFYRARVGKANVVITCSGAGNIAAARAATTVIERFKPTYLFMIGIAAGFKDKVDLGDVVVAEACYYDGSGKETPEGKLPAPRQIPVSATLLQYSRNYTLLDWKERIQTASPAGGFQPSVHYGVIVSSETVIGDDERMATFLKLNRQCRALAMEGYGVAEAAHSHKIDFVEIRGICDFGTVQKNDEWHEYAAHVVAAYTVGLIGYMAESLPKRPKWHVLKPWLNHWGWLVLAVALLGSGWWLGDRYVFNVNHQIVNSSVVNHYNISPEMFAKYAADLGVTDNALANFFKILAQAKVDRADLDNKLREIAESYKKLLENFKLLDSSDDPVVRELLQQAQQAISGEDAHGKPVTVDFAKAEQLLQQAFEQEQHGIAQLEAIEEKARAAREKKQLSAAEIMARQGDLAKTQVRYRESARYFQKAVELLPAGHEEKKAECLNNAGVGFHHAGEYDKALLLFEQALQIDKKAYGNKHPFYALSLNNLAVLYNSQGKYDQALPLFKQALQIRKEVLGLQHPRYAESLNNLAVLYRAQGEYDKALPLFKQALEIHQQVLGLQHPDTANSLNNLAALYQAQGEYDRVLPLYDQALEIYKQVLGLQHPDYAVSLNNLSFLYCSQGEYDKALPLYEQAVAIVVKALGEKHPDTQLYKKNYERCRAAALKSSEP